MILFLMDVSFSWTTIWCGWLSKDCVVCYNVVEKVGQMFAKCYSSGFLVHTLWRIDLDRKSGFSAKKLFKWFSYTCIVNNRSWSWIWIFQKLNQISEFANSITDVAIFTEDILCHVNGREFVRCSDVKSCSYHWHNQWVLYSVLFNENLFEGNRFCA